MSEIDTPQGIDNDAPLSMAEAIKAYSSEPEEEVSTEEVEETETEDEPDEAETPDDDQTDDQDDDEEADEDGEPDDDGEDDEPDEGYSQGRFASDDAKVRLDDGTTVTIAELKRGSLREGDYTRKTQALAEERKTLETNQSKVKQLEQQLSQERELVQSFAEQLLPKAPDRSMMDTDPMGYMQAKAEYDDRMARLQHLGSIRQQEQQRQQAEQAERIKQQRATEAQKLLEAMPELKEPKRYQEFFNSAAQAMQDHYGFTAEEVAGAMDHRFYPIFRDLVAYQRIKANKSKVQKKVEGKPPVMKSGKRLSRGQQKAQARKAAFDRLDKSGSIRDGVAALLASQDEG